MTNEQLDTVMFRCDKSSYCKLLGCSGISREVDLYTPYGEQYQHSLYCDTAIERVVMSGYIAQ